MNLDVMLDPEGVPHHLVFGQRLAEMRKANGLSQAALGHAIGRTQKRIAQLETGTVRLLFQEAITIAGVLGVEVGVLDPSRGPEPTPAKWLTPEEFAGRYLLSARSRLEDAKSHTWQFSLSCGRGHAGVFRASLDPSVDHPGPGFLISQLASGRWEASDGRAAL